MTTVRWAMFAALVHSSARMAMATNVAFMPGDACFPSVLTLTDAERLSRSEIKFELHYNDHSFKGYGCGSAGYRSIEIVDIPESWPKTIHTVYATLRTQRPRNLIQDFGPGGKIVEEMEFNGFRMLVYNRPFDFNTYHVGLRYNERWMNPLPNAPNASHAAEYYRPYLEDFRAVAEDWKNSPNVEGLNVKLPDLKAIPDEEVTSASVTASAKDIQLVILPEQDLEGYYHKRLDTHSNFVVVNSDGVWRYSLQKNQKIQVVPWTRQLELGDKEDEAENE